MNYMSGFNIFIGLVLVTIAIIPNLGGNIIWAGLTFAMGIVNIYNGIHFILKEKKYNKMQKTLDKFENKQVI